MNILFASSEAYPFFTSGKLGDMIGSLARALKRLNIDVRVVLPLYKDMKSEWQKKLRYVTDYNVPVSWRNQYCGLYELVINGVYYYFLDNEYYFKRPYFYGYEDDCERFAFFSRAILETIRRIDFTPQIIQCNDWQTALVPVYLKLYYRQIDKFTQMKTIFTIHDIQYQGKYSSDIAEWVLGIGQENSCLMEYDGVINFLKGAIETANIVSTVSPSYALEILDPLYGCGLEHFLREHNSKIRGILSGIDTDEYNPATDTIIASQYDLNSFPEGKDKCKAQLRRLLNLEQRNVPIIGMVTRFINHKGPELLVQAADEILKTGMQLAILGQGENSYERFFMEMSARYKGQCSVFIGFLPDIARNIYAGSDIFLMPSRTEPCGLAQMLALRYGSIPIVREIGGLKDTVIDGDNGFVFSAYNADEMRGACFRAFSLWQNRKEWAAMVQRAMKCDNSWTIPAKKYAALFQETLRT